MTRLYRSRRDRVIAGVAGGLALNIGIDPSLVRIGWVVLAFASGGLVVLLYILMALIVPEEPETPFEAPPAGFASSPGAAAGAASEPVTPWTPGTETSWDAGAAAEASTAAATPRRRRDERTTALVIGAILVIAGLLLLLRRYIPLLEPDVVWPIVLVVLGVLLLLGSARRR